MLCLPAVAMGLAYLYHQCAVHTLRPKKGGRAARAVSMLSAYGKPISNSALALQTHMVLCIVKGPVRGCGRRGSVAEDEQQVESKPSKSIINVETTPCDAPAFAHRAD